MSKIRKLGETWTPWTVQQEGRASNERTAIWVGAILMVIVLLPVLAGGARPVGYGQQKLVVDCGVVSSLDANQFGYQSCGSPTLTAIPFVPGANHVRVVDSQGRWKGNICQLWGQIGCTRRLDVRP